MQIPSTLEGYSRKQVFARYVVHKLVDRRVKRCTKRPKRHRTPLRFSRFNQRNREAVCDCAREMYDVAMLAVCCLIKICIALEKFHKIYHITTSYNLITRSRENLLDLLRGYLRLTSSYTSSSYSRPTPKLCSCFLQLPTRISTPFGSLDPKLSSLVVTQRPYPSKSLVKRDTH